MNSLTIKNVYSYDYQNYIMKLHIKRQLSGLLTKIHGLYKTEFTATSLQSELQKMYAEIDKLIIGFDVTIINKVNIPSTIGGTGILSLCKGITMVKKIIPVLDTKDLCAARVYDQNMIIYKSDASGKILYGRQCRKKRISKYCNMHSQHNPHGDWLNEPTSALKQHFMILNEKYGVPFTT